MAGKYDHKAVEKKWQKRWEESQAFKADEDSKKEKLYVLDMFPYPSGAGLHVGHVEGYTATDIYSRFKRMQGFNVLHPMGWDAFGLPAENYAIKTGVPPVKTTEESINAFRAQIKSLGLSYDWSREIGTHTPEYYKWTQWFFLFLYNNGLAEKRMAKVNWCPKDQTVLANEQTVSETGEKGVCVRCGTKVIQKDLAQWFFKITEFSDALANDLDQVDWPESTKIAQRNWIGRSEGAEIDFEVSGLTKSRITVFTTRPDTLFGATYLVLAPEHALVASLAENLENKEEVETYVAAAKNKTDLERQEEQKDKTGVELKGVKAINPANKEEIPIYVADYVLGGYGTGAIMAVPAHDERDYQFAKKFNIPIKEVIEPTYEQGTEPGKIREGEPFDHREAIIAIVKHWQEDKYIALKWKQVAWGTFITGGIEPGQTPETAAKAELAEEVGYTDAKFVRDFGVVHGKFYHVPKKTNRNAHAHVVYLELQSDARAEVAQNEQAIHEVLWLTADELKKFLTPDTHLHALRWLLGEQDIYTGYGTLSNSGKFTRLESEEAKKKITDFVGGKWVTTYRLRDWLISRQRYWGAPIPVVYDPEGKPHPIPEEHLPWMLPTDVEFSPKGTSPLGQSKELLERTEKIFGKGWKPEIDTMDTFVCSSWYYFRFGDPHNETAFASPEAIQKWLPVDLYVGGAEHTVLHLLYSRFITKALQKHGLIDFTEPFLKLRHQGLIGGEDGRKMSKSFGNVVNPMDITETYGADTLRLYEMFMGPLETHKPWSSQNIIGTRRFLERVWKLEVGDGALDAKTETLLHQTIKKVGEDLDGLKMNTAISSLMILLNALAELPSVPREAYKIFLQMLYPLAPHIASELWEGMGESAAIHEIPWPRFDAAKIVSATAKIAVQVNGKLRATVDIPASAGEEEALAAARGEAGVAKWLALGKEVKAVYVPGKVISFVVH
ncbi:MAG TPA: leucine--tRNA ligase [Candidatus Paceibacterota bacterium]|nr:leucine--tRNA ligase [Candidatus Paceibacterota bacterium]